MNVLEQNMVGGQEIGFGIIPIPFVVDSGSKVFLIHILSGLGSKNVPCLFHRFSLILRTIIETFQQIDSYLNPFTFSQSKEPIQVRH